MNRRPLAALGAALVLLVSGAAAAPAPPSPDDRELAESVVKWMGAVFAVPDEPDLDASLRAAMTTLVKEHLARLDTLVPA